MSHFMKVKTHVNDLVALKDAAKDLGLGFAEHAGARGYGCQVSQCDAVVKLKGPYDVGFNKQQDGNFEMTCDWWQGHVEKEIGKNGGSLMQAYAYNKVAREAGKRGYTTQKTMEKDGKLRVTVGGF